MRIASIPLANSASAPRASKVSNPITLRWEIGWGPGGASLDISIYAPLSPPVTTEFQNQTHLLPTSLLTTFHLHLHQSSSLVGAKFHAVSLAQWDSPFLIRCLRRRGKDAAIFPPRMPPLPLSQLPIPMYQNFLQPSAPQSPPPSRRRCSQPQA